MFISITAGFRNSRIFHRNCCWHICVHALISNDFDGILSGLIFFQLCINMFQLCSYWILAKKSESIIFPVHCLKSISGLMVIGHTIRSHMAQQKGGPA